ncbi:hypothetical protein [Actinosynnema sp. ALI-1.44]|uniref:hypothetical protein n=1 Tax=Actinosynnema sp. ALI-1.44 TaxID=1933779 RepID=UPI00143D2A35|nr:hypothetical protein [Actinosynnema sp. ALI-1.44]
MSYSQISDTLGCGITAVWAIVGVDETGYSIDPRLLHTSRSVLVMVRLLSGVLVR